MDCCKKIPAGIHLLLFITTLQRGGTCEAHGIYDFDTFLMIFSMQNFACNLEGQKFEKKMPKAEKDLNFEADSAVPASLGGSIVGWGGRQIWPKFQAWP